MVFKSKKKIIEELKEEILSLKDQKRDLNDEVNKLEAKLRHDRVCGGYCGICKHGYKAEYNVYSNAYYNLWGCELDCTCKDFVKKEK